MLKLGTPELLAAGPSLEARAPAGAGADVGLLDRVARLEKLLQHDQAGKSVLTVDRIEMTGDKLEITRGGKPIVRVVIGTNSFNVDGKVDADTTHSLEVVDDQGRAPVHMTALSPGICRTPDGREGMVEGQGHIGIRSNFSIDGQKSFGDMIFMTNYRRWGTDRVGDSFLKVRHPVTGGFSATFSRNGTALTRDKKTFLTHEPRPDQDP